MPRRRDRPSRLLFVLALSVGVPGLVLSTFALRSVQAEIGAEELQFQLRCESVGGGLYEETRERFVVLEDELGDAIDQAGDRWAQDPEQTVRETVERVEGLQGIVILDESGQRLYPAEGPRRYAEEHDVARFEQELRTVMGKAFEEAERAEFVDGDHARAAELYRAAIPGIPGYRGQLISRNAMARCLYEAGSVERAKVAYQRLAREAAGYRDLNGFPLDLLAAYQVGLCELTVDDRSAAAQTFRALLVRLTDESWGYGGNAEALMADMVIERLSDPTLRGRLAEDQRVDLDTARRVMAQRQEQQLLQSRVVALLGELFDARDDLQRASGRFLYQRPHQGDQALLFARTTWSSPGGRRVFLLLLDEALLLDGLSQRLDGIAQANPELALSFGEVSAGPSPLSAPSEGVVLQLEPWVPGRTLMVSRGDPSRMADILSRGRRLRVATIFAVTLLILLGMIVSYRAVQKEFEVARARTDFVSNVSHELRTPITTIRLMSEMLSIGAVPGEEKQREYHQTILSESERLTRLIDNVLSFARIEQGRKKYRFRTGRVADLTEEIRRVTRDYLADSAFELEVDVEEGLPAARFDPDALTQALINLVTNAVLYTNADDPARRHIHLSAFRERDTIVLAVRDHGQGIEPKDQDRIFEKFQRGGAPLTRTVRGAGLGLSIVRHIIEAHGGKVRLTSDTGKGSTFSLVLPLPTGDG
jgi:signal transduction histidine kinase